MYEYISLTSSLSLSLHIDTTLYNTRASTSKHIMPGQNHYADSNFDVRSHYSDSAAVVATLYNLTAAGDSGVAIPTHDRVVGGGTNSTTDHRTPSSQPFHTNSMHRNLDKSATKTNVAAPPSTCATLQRTNGYFRSNQSLCSCNADSEVER